MNQRVTPQLRSTDWERTRAFYEDGLGFRVQWAALEIIQLIQDDGWYQVAQKGSHRQFKHDAKQGRVTVAGKPNDDLAPGTSRTTT